MEDALNRSHRSLVEIESIAQAGHWPQKPLRHEDEYRIDTNLHFAIEDEPAAEEEGTGEPSENDHSDERNERRRIFDRLLVRQAIIVRDFADPGGLAGFRGESLDGGDSAKVGIDCRTEF